jgi:hypothetical protein
MNTKVHKTTHGVQNPRTNESTIHGVKVISYDKLGDITHSTFITGDKLHEFMYSCKTRKFINIEEAKHKKSPFNKTNQVA